MTIGIDVKEPAGRCSDIKCPFHGELKVRGRILTGVVISDKAKGTVAVEREFLRFLKKFERYEKRTAKLQAHNPGCINAKLNDVVKIAECRPLSRTKHFVVVEVMKRGAG